MPNACSAAPVTGFSLAAISIRTSRCTASSVRARSTPIRESKEFLGINADDIGGGEIVATEGDVATLALQRTTQEVRLGDRLFSGEERSINSTFMPSSPKTEINGLIIDVPRGVTQIGAMDVVTLNKGQRDGLAEGNVLVVMKTGETVRDRITGQPLKIPDERAGLLMVFRTYDKLSYGLVLNASRSLAVMDKVRNPKPAQQVTNRVIHSLFPFERGS